MENDLQFFKWLDQWITEIPSKTLEQILPIPENGAILSVDLINGFCYEGPLASPRVANIVPFIVSLMKKAWVIGVREYVLIQDTHEPDAVEFSQFPPHCIRGTSEAETVGDIMNLPFYRHMLTLQKNSIDSGLNTSLDSLVDSKPELDTFIVVGDCTDLCTYQLAMHLRLQANARQIQRRVIIPIECVDTYHLGVEDALKIGAFPHPGDLIHKVFLYHMALNGIEMYHFTL
jgi:nicotinamidase-related amidase